MKKTLIKLTLLIFTLCMPLTFKTTAHAQSVTLTQENFDYEWYLKEHPDVFAALGNDHAAIWNFYVTLGEPAGWYGRPYIISLTKRYSAETLGIIYTVANTICDTYPLPYDRALAAHDWLCNYIDYDYTYKSHSVESTILQKTAVCQGYAETFDLLAELCGLRSDLVSGVADNGSSKAGHAWNKVTINGIESYVDCTWDDFTRDYNYVVHDCFMITKEKMDWIHDGKVYHFMNGQPVGYY